MKTDKPNVPRHQHYVPRVYLKNFAVQRGRNYVVDVYDVKNKQGFPTNIKNICTERDLYTLDSEYYSHPLAIEKNVYADTIEPMYEEAYRLLIDDNVTAISDIQRAHIIIAVYQLYFRNPNLLNEVIAYKLPAIEKAYNEAKGKGEKHFVFLEEEYDIENKSYEEIQIFFSKAMQDVFKTIHLEQFKDLLKVRALDSINVFKIVDDSYFITSDNPFFNLSFLNPGSRDPFARDTMFYLPLNSEYCLGLISDKSTTGRNKIHRHDADYLFSLPINHNIASAAQRFIIGSKEAIEDVTVHFADLFSSKVTDQFIAFATDMYERYIETIPGLECLKPYIDEYERTGELSTEKFTEMSCKYAEVVKGTLLENDKNWFLSTLLYPLQLHSLAFIMNLIIVWVFNRGLYILPLTNMITYEDMNPNGVTTKQVKQFLKSKGYKVSVRAQTGSIFWYYYISSDTAFTENRNLIDLLNEYFYWIGDDKICVMNWNFASIKRSKTKKPLLFNN